MELLTYENFLQYSENNNNITELKYKLLFNEIVSEISILSGINLLEIKNISETTSLLIIKVLLDTIEYENRKGINSESVGKWSVSYNTDAPAYKLDRSKKLNNIINMLKKENNIDGFTSLYVKG